MKSRPIIFDGESVRAILAGTKSMTRRVVKPQPPADAVEAAPNGYEGPEGPSWFWMKEGKVSPMFLPRGTSYWPNTLAGAKPISCPYGAPGDELWVREAHYRFTGCAPEWESFVSSPTGDPYQARCYDDSAQIKEARFVGAVVRMSPIHMPRWASRITLRVTGVRVERVRDISELDCEAELGVAPYALGDSAYSRFRDRWDSINAKRGYPWASNPWVWAVTFEARSGPNQ